MRILALLCLISFAAREVTATVSTTDLDPRAYDQCLKLDGLQSIANSISTLKASDNGTDDSTEWDEDGSSSMLRLLKRARSDNPLLPESLRWTPRVNRGRMLWQRLQARLTDLRAEDKPRVCDLASRWGFDVDGLNDAHQYHDHAEDDITEILPKEVLAFPQQVKSFRDCDMYYPKGTDYDESEFRYVQAFSPRYGIIQVIDIKALNQDSIVEPNKRAPDRWSDVTYSIWKSMCEEESKPASSLKFILRDSITNGYTQSIIDDATDGLEEVDDQGRGVFRATFSPDAEGVMGEAFFAMLTTPNVIGVVYMLMDYLNDLGRRTIKSISVHKYGQGDEDDGGDENSYYAWIELEDYNAGGVQGTVSTNR